MESLIYFIDHDFMTHQYGRMRQIVLNQAHCYARRLLGVLQAIVATEQGVVSLGET